MASCAEAATSLSALLATAPPHSAASRTTWNAMRGSQGIQSLAAHIVQQAVEDYQYAPMNTAAYRTAKKFLFGGECVHLICWSCDQSDIEGWRAAECPPGDSAEACVCAHGWEMHAWTSFDWVEHAELVIGAAGLDPESIQREVRKRERP